MFELKIDVTAFERQAKKLKGSIDQVPFALSLALNKAVQNTRNVLVQDTWPRHVTQRNQAFIRRALRIAWSRKETLRVEIFDDLGKASLKLHADGGTRRPRKRVLTIPPNDSATRDSRGSTGVRKNLRPGAIITSTPKRALRITPKGIFVGKGGRLHLMYAFKASAQQPGDVPFRSDFETAMVMDLRTSFPAAMSRAMGWTQR